MAALLSSNRDRHHARIILKIQGGLLTPRGLLAPPYPTIPCCRSESKLSYMNEQMVYLIEIEDVYFDNNSNVVYDLHFVCS